MLTIETTAKQTIPQAREITNITLQAKSLLIKPEAKLQNYFRFCPISMGISGACLAIFGTLAICGRGDILIYICIGIMAITFLLGLLIYRTAKSFEKGLLKKDGSVTVVLDEEGVYYNNHVDNQFKVGWSGISLLSTPHTNRQIVGKIRLIYRQKCGYM